MRVCFERNIKKDENICPVRCKYKQDYKIYYHSNRTMKYLVVRYNQKKLRI